MMKAYFVGTAVPGGPCTALVIAERTVQEAGPYISLIAMNLPPLQA